MPKKWCFWTVVLEKTLESLLDSKENQPVSPKGILPWIYIGMTDAEAETPIFWPPDVKRWRSSIQSAKTRPGADYGSDHELFIAKFRLKLKKVRKTTRPFLYDLNSLWLYSGSEK